MSDYYSECPYAECHYAECRGTKITLTFKVTLHFPSAV
jgi:hypothetical protein